MASKTPPIKMTKAEKEAKSRARSSWHSMKHSCKNRYGNLGYPAKWGDFEVFYLDMGGRPEGTVFTRVNSRLPYSKRNCMYAPRAEAHTNREWNRIIPYRGEKKNLFAWGRKLDIKHQTLLSRLDRGWTVERSFTEPVKGKKKGKATPL